ncbi:MAG: hypothetical protein ACKOE5_07305 [Cytophagales bacterium]
MSNIKTLLFAPLNKKIIKMKNSVMAFIALFLSGACAKDSLAPAPVLPIPIMTVDKNSLQYTIEREQTVTTTVSVSYDDNGAFIGVRGVTYSETPNPVVGTALEATKTASNLPSIITFSGLKKSTKYFARAYSKTDKDVIHYSPAFDFTTPDKDLSRTISITNFEVNSLGAKIYFSFTKEHPAEIGVYFGTSSNVSYSESNKVIGSVNVTTAGNFFYYGPFNDKIQAPGTYYVKPYVKYADGTIKSDFANIISFIKS